MGSMDVEDSGDFTLEEQALPALETVPTDRIRASYDAVAAAYSRDLSDEIIAKPIERGMLLAFAEVVQSLGRGVVGDVGCGPGHVAQHLYQYGLATQGIDISQAMIAEARERFPAGAFDVASMFDLPVAGGAWIAAVTRYAALHYGAEERGLLFRELARVIRPGGYLLHAFYISAPDQPPGSIYRLETWYGHPVELDVHFVGVEQASDELDRFGFEVEAALVREPMSKTELPTRRCYMLARRR